MVETLLGLQAPPHGTVTNCLSPAVFSVVEAPHAALGRKCLLRLARATGPQLSGFRW